MNKSCCFVLQYNTGALVLVLQYCFGKQAILRQYQKSLSCKSACTAHKGISDRVSSDIIEAANPWKIRLAFCHCPNNHNGKKIRF
jgi:hypothetical protein